MNTVNLKKDYQEALAAKLQAEAGYSSIMQVARMSKIVINMGLGEAIDNKKIITAACEDMAKISGQKPKVTKARKSIAGFKIRDGWPIGCKVTLRGDRMYDFLARLIHVAIPRIRDFRGLSVKGFDGMGNYNFGLTEQIVFPEIEYDKIDKIRGLDIAIATTAKTDADAEALLRAFKFPLRERK
jgi:large subunit ribosomal protein L5